jgi:ribose transport system substrate-binding protein
VVLAAAALAVIPACGGRSGKIKVAIVTNCTHKFWDICEAGAKAGATEFDVEVIFRQPKTNTVADQMEIVEGVQKLGIQGLGVSVIKPDDQTPDLKRISGKVNLITVDTDAPESGRLCYVGVDNFEAGKDAGRLVKQALPDGGTIALFIGNTTQANSKGRIAGVLTELAGTDVRADVEKGEYAKTYGNYTLYKAPITDDTVADVALAKAGEALENLKKTPNVCLVGLFAYNPPALLEATRTKKLVGQVKIVGFDEDLVTLDGIDNGEIAGSISQDPYNYGYESVKWLAHVARGGDKGKLPQTATPHKLLLKEKDTPKPAGSTAPVEKASEFAVKIRDALDKK